MVAGWPFHVMHAGQVSKPPFWKPIAVLQSANDCNGAPNITTAKSAKPSGVPMSRGMFFIVLVFVVCYLCFVIGDVQLPIAGARRAAERR